MAELHGSLKQTARAAGAPAGGVGSVKSGFGGEPSVEQTRGCLHVYADATAHNKGRFR